MIRLLLLLSALALALPAIAQEKPDEAAEAREAAERRADGMLRVMGQLSLSESQKAQIKALMVEADLASQKAREASSAKIRALLTPEQQETYDQWTQAQRRWSRGAWGRGQRGQRGGQRGMQMGGGMSQLAELNLTEEQQKKVREIYEKAGSVWTDAWQKQQAGESVDWRKLMQEYREKTAGEVKKVLNADQQKKFAELNKRWDDMMQRWGVGRGARGGSGTRSVTPQVTVRATPAQRAAALTDQAVAALNCSEEEEAVFRPLVAKLVDYKVKGGARLADQGRALARLAAGDADEATLAAKADALARARAEYREKLVLYESGVRELLTKRQEYALIGLEVLDPQ